MTSPDTPPGSERPSMFDSSGGGRATSPAAGEAATGLRMLSGLQPNVGKAKDVQPRPRSKWLAAALLSIAVIAVAAVGLHMNGDPTPVVAPPEAQARPHEAVVAVGVADVASLPVAAASASSAASAVPAPTVASTVASVSQTGAAAVIETVAAPAASAASAPLASAPLASAPAGVRVAEGNVLAEALRVVPAASSALPASAPKVQRASQVAKAHPPQASTPTKVAAVHRPAIASASVKTGKTASSTRSAPRGDRDSDVELLTAMMAHLDGESSGRALLPPSSAAEQKPTAQRMRSCERLSSAEATQCRRKVCDGHWGKVPACPAKLAPAGSFDVEKSR